MKKIIMTSLLTASVLIFGAGCAASKTGGEAAGQGAKYGAAGGAILGLTLGAITGDAKFAAAGLAAGAVVGGASGAMYEYKEHRDDNRTKMLSDAIGGAKKGETVDEAGKRHLADFTGNWKIDVTVLSNDGKMLKATGNAKITLESKTTLNIAYDAVKPEGYDEMLSGETKIIYDEKEGFNLDSKFSNSDKITNFVGEYMPKDNIYVYYPQTSNPNGKANARVELRVSGTNMFIAESFALIDGKEIKTQTYRFTRI